MIINKITAGFVIQQFDTEKNQYINQSFVADGETVYEDENGNTSNVVDEYLPFKMVQPVPPEKWHHLFLLR